MGQDGYDITIHGLLRKRSELMLTLEVKRDELAAAQNDILAIERVLETLGHTDELDQPRRRVLKDIRRQLSRFVLDEIRKDGPHTTRTIADRLAAMEGKDAGDKKLMKDITARVSKCMTGLVDRKAVVRTKTQGIRCLYGLAG
jgi:hypothetical protein